MGTDVFKSVDGQYLKVGYIKSDDEINNETEQGIRSKYSVSDELKLNRLANASGTVPTEFTEYNDFVESYREAGSAKKAAAAVARLALKEVDLPQESGDPVKIMVAQ